MKKVLLTLMALFIASTAVMAEEAVTTAIDEAVNSGKPVQGVDIEKSGAVIVLQKQPQLDTSIQYVKVRKCGLVAVITLNGKVKEAKTETTEE